MVVEFTVWQFKRDTVAWFLVGFGKRKEWLRLELGRALGQNSLILLVIEEPVAHQQLEVN